MTTDDGGAPPAPPRLKNHPDGPTLQDLHARPRAPGKARGPKPKTPHRAARAAASVPAAEPLPTPPTPDERVAECLDLMVTGRFITGVTIRQLAVKWGVHLKTAQYDSAAASRMLRLSPEEAAAKRDMLLVNLEELQRMATEQGNVISAIKAVQAQADILGLHVQKHALVEVGEVTEADAARLVREKFGAHGAVAAPATEPEPTP